MMSHFLLRVETLSQKFIFTIIVLEKINCIDFRSLEFSIDFSFDGLKISTIFGFGFKIRFSLQVMDLFS